MESLPSIPNIILLFLMMSSLFDPMYIPAFNNVFWSIWLNQSVVKLFISAYCIYCANIELLSTHSLRISGLYANNSIKSLNAVNGFSWNTLSNWVATPL